MAFGLRPRPIPAQVLLIFKFGEIKQEKLWQPFSVQEFKTFRFFSKHFEKLNKWPISDFVDRYSRTMTEADSKEKRGGERERERERG